MVKGEKISIFSKPSLKPYSSKYTLIAVIVLDETVTHCFTKTANHFTIEDNLLFLQVVLLVQDLIRFFWELFVHWLRPKDRNILDVCGEAACYYYKINNE